MISESKSRKEAVNKEHDEVKLLLKINEEKNFELQKQKTSLEQELKSQSVELKLLESAQHDTKWQSEIQHLQEMIAEKKEKIEMLREQLNKVEHDLHSEKKTTDDLRSQVSHLESELREKAAELHGYEIEVMRTKFELKEQRHELDQLNQLQAANSTQKALFKEIEVRGSIETVVYSFI